jgi:NMD protein affecting ribosome stability and mRNA decay
MKAERGGFRMLQHEQLLQEMTHDPYKPTAKAHEPVACPLCGAVYHRGRWSWRKAPPKARASLCPACRRIREHAPAGFVTLGGEFFRAHRDEILAQVRHCEEAEKSDHPLQRIMNIQAEGDGLLVTTTDSHLARRIGDALHHAYRGELAYHYNKEENLLRVVWTH